MKKILVTGTSGFIGFHTARYYLEKGYNVLAVDNFNDYYNPELKNERAKVLKSEFGLDIVRLDIADFSSLQTYFRENEFESVIHLAAQAGIRIKTEENHKYTQSNLLGFSNIASLAVVHKVKNFTYASSSSVYGNEVPAPYKENSHLIKPVSFYGATKLSNEIMASTLAETGETIFTGLRFFTAYGEWGRPDMAYFRIAESLLNGGRFPLFGDGMVRRDFTYIADIVEGIVRIHEYRENHGNSASEIFNIGGGSPHSITELIQMFEKITGKSLKVDSLPSVKADVKLTIADTTKLTDATNFLPQVSLEKGLSFFLDWCTSVNIRSQLGAWVKS
jgi:UDP-glucuronate 4-epimerase